MEERPLEFLSTFLLKAPALDMRQDAGKPFPKKQGKESSSRAEKGQTGLLLNLAGPSVFFSTGHGYVGNFLSCRKCVKDPFGVQA